MKLFQVHRFALSDPHILRRVAWSNTEWRVFFEGSPFLRVLKETPFCGSLQKDTLELT